MRAGTQAYGDLPPIVLATLRVKMTELSAEIAEGAVWANASRSHIGASLSHIPRRNGTATSSLGTCFPPASTTMTAPPP